MNQHLSVRIPSLPHRDPCSARRRRLRSV